MTTVPGVVRTVTSWVGVSFKVLRLGRGLYRKLFSIPSYCFLILLYLCLLFKKQSSLTTLGDAGDTMPSKTQGDAKPTQKLTVGCSGAEKWTNAHVRNRKYSRVIKGEPGADSRVLLWVWDQPELQKSLRPARSTGQDSSQKYKTKLQLDDMKQTRKHCLERGISEKTGTRNS